ncbi:carbohydrate ABC transporter permease [Microcella humidisoli]|uniref:Carbohydrate ABC transporter permease n=1 Tax=Microcella humidisoli TaxID=2963406 RepID=A0ABY5FZD0_9MICO|nr:carbohydrate ABC transporter permease [Microcella humidisoli]UTT63690.1 carbohydrate ABC transporter permease [Microcella humidisoli]
MIGKLERATGVAILVLAGISGVAPIAIALLFALRDPGSLGGSIELSGGLRWDNFARAWDLGGFGQSLLNSFVIVAIVVPLAATVSILNGYALGSLRVPGERWIFMGFLLGLMMPLEALVIPLFYTMRDLGLTNTWWSVALPLAALHLAFGTFWMRAALRSLPAGLVEAATMDGASSWQILWKVLVPSVRPAIVVLVLLMFMWTWNDFLLALVMLSSPSIRTAPLSLTQFQGQFSADFTLIAAGSILVALPVVALYAFLQREFIRGMLSGAIKE